MTVYVDKIFRHPLDGKDAQTKRNFRNGGCHMWADSVAELKSFAASIGLKLAWFQDRPRFPHFDITPGKRIQAMRAGAVEKSLRQHIREKKEY